MPNRLIVTSLALAIAILPMGPAAGTDEETRPEGVAAAETWLSLIDEGETGKSWETAAVLFKGAVTQEQWVQKIEAVRGPLGELISREVTLTKYETSLPGAPDGEYVVIQFETVFENKSAAVETVTPMKDPDGTWRVAGYFIK